VRPTVRMRHEKSACDGTRGQSTPLANRGGCWAVATTTPTQPEPPGCNRPQPPAVRSKGMANAACGKARMTVHPHHFGPIEPCHDPKGRVSHALSLTSLRLRRFPHDSRPPDVQRVRSAQRAFVCNRPCVVRPACRACAWATCGRTASSASERPRCPRPFVCSLALA
jgi:hypothetical protein